MTRPNTREQILEAGLKCLVEKGFNAVGVQDITDAAGVPKGSFYNHFESKEAMGVEALARYAETQGMAELADERVPPLTRLRAHFDRLADQARERDYARGCLLGNFAAEVADHSELLRGH